MLEFVECSICVAWYVSVESAILVVTLELDAHVQFPFPIDGYVVVLFQGVDQVIGVHIACELNSKIIHY